MTKPWLCCFKASRKRLEHGVRGSTRRSRVFLSPSWVVQQNRAQQGFFFWLLLFDPCHSFHNTKKRQYRKTASSPNLLYLKAVCGLKSIESQMFSSRDKFLSSLHRSKLLKVKYPHACCWKWKFPRAMSKIPCFSRRCDRTTGHGALSLKSNFPRSRVAQSNQLKFNFKIFTSFLRENDHSLGL